MPIKITYPNVYLVSRQWIDDDALDAFLADENIEEWQTDTLNGAEQITEVAGRLCYMSFAKPRPGGNKAYVDHILDQKHGSVLEHAVFGVIITGVTRSLTHELVRHRAGMSYSQLSQRYVDGSEVGFVPPAVIEDHKDIYETWKFAMEVCQRAYTYIVERLDEEMTHIENRTLRTKRAREAARSVLPNSTETKIFVTGNARAWRHFIESRGSTHADQEIRHVAFEVLSILKSAAPNLFSDYRMAVSSDGEPYITTKYRKV